MFEFGAELNNYLSNCSHCSGQNQLSITQHGSHYNGRLSFCLFWTNCCCCCQKSEINHFPRAGGIREQRLWAAGITKAVTARLDVRTTGSIRDDVVYWENALFTHRPPPSASLSPRSLCCLRGWRGRAAVSPWRRAGAPAGCSVTTSGSAPRLQTPAGWTRTGTEPADNETIMTLNKFKTMTVKAKRNLTL